MLLTYLALVRRYIWGSGVLAWLCFLGLIDSPWQVLLSAPEEWRHTAWEGQG